MVRTEYNLAYNINSTTKIAEIVIWWPSTEIAERNLIYVENMSWGGGGGPTDT